jgi:hypothetical protein
VGQMLNAEFIIVGTVDHIGRVYSVNIRQINVASGAIASNVKSDCADCTIEDVMLKKLREAARQIAGIDTVRQQDVVTEQKGRKLIKCKTYKGGEAGTLSISGMPKNSEVLIDSISYGNGNMVIDYAPVGNHVIWVKNGKKVILKEKVTIGYGKTAEFDYVNSQNRRYHFCLGPGMALGLPNVSSGDYRYKFVNETNIGDTISGPNDKSFKWLPIMPTLAFNWSNQKNAIGFVFGAMYTTGQTTRTDSQANNFVFNVDNGFWELFFTYHRTLLNVDDFFKAELGFLAGGSYTRMDVNPAYAVVHTTQQKYFALSNYQANGVNYNEDNGKFEQIMFGGPSLVVNGGYKFVYLNVSFSLLLGMDNQGSPTPFSYSQQPKVWEFNVNGCLGTSIIFKF